MKFSNPNIKAIPDSDFPYIDMESPQLKAHLEKSKAMLTSPKVRAQLEKILKRS
ncbi:MAG: hypothetical protein MUE30_18965 [Spirosomaceae bacterium]|jgi:hypothetical protein|nr:hypothetical protein [Spirosomataceae bacterium]